VLSFNRDDTVADLPQIILILSDLGNLSSQNCPSSSKPFHLRFDLVRGEVGINANLINALPKLNDGLAIELKPAYQIHPIPESRCDICSSRKLQVQPLCSFERK